MLDSRSSNELDLAYMPYHEGLVNHNAPPVRGSLSVRVSNQQQHSPYYGDSDDDDVSDDPAWMTAPRGSLQPAFPPNLMKKASSNSGGRRSLNNNVDDKLTTDLKLRKCKSMPMNQALANPADNNKMVNLGVPRNSRGNSEIDRLSVEKKSSDAPSSPEGASRPDRNTDFTERDPVHGQSAMHIAVRFGQLHAVQLLCGKKTRGLLIDAVDNRQNTPLHLAAAKSRRITKYLLEHGADASRVNNRNQTPLAVHIVTTKRDDPLIPEMLLQHKTDPNSALGNSTLLHKAVDLKLFEIASRLVRHGGRLDSKDAQGCMVFEKVDRKVLRQLCGKIAYPPVWVPNMERKGCMICLRNFSRLGVGVRRHHCRHCGRLICGRCSHVSVESEAFPSTFIGHIDRNASDERSNLKRVCKTCSSVFDERAKQGKESSPGGNQKWSDAFMDRSTYCNNMHEFCAASGRMTYVVNLDPAADHFDYPVAFDIRDLISVEDVMEELGYGPNGGLIYCMEYLVQNLDWLQDLLGEYSDEDYFIFDCPGQIELYSHLPVMKQLCDSLKDWGFNICCVYLIDSLFVVDPTKFISGVLCSLSAMVQLELPHINVLTKCDLVDEKEMSKYLDPSEGYLLENLANSTDPKWRPLSTAICNVINDFSMVAFVPMNINREESIETVLMHVDHAINYGDDLEPQEPKSQEADE
ncbi:hypothetical protein JG688_00001554 [Phytophthora aleatoria]|uniref:GPN-loop GTPase 3 n=1 Tax=Phytophthora aleatoria TaxID=2496075 RepID=A0A8J5MD92_9STRA|nr:hypothetical protein JG688_00001554 [Phytophthora aleatoria]